MTILDFANLFDTPRSIEALLSYKAELLESDLALADTIENLFSMIEQGNVATLDRQSFTKLLITYICTTGDSVPFIMKTFDILLQKDGCQKEDIDRIKKMAYKQARDTREKKLQQEMQERKKSREEQKRREAYFQKLEASIDMSKTVVNYDTARFLVRNGVTYEDLEKSPTIRLMSQKDIDPILHKYRIESDGKEELVSIADVVGYSYHGENDLLKSFSNFFDSNKSGGYYQRALSMLDFTTDDALEKLSSSFRVEPMKLADAPEGKFTISTNGMHRYSVLRALYCIEMLKANGDKTQEENIYNKYKVPAIVAKIDYVKTYANYILTTLKVAAFVSNERDDNCRSTGKARVQLVNGEELFLTNEELLQYVGDIIRKNKDYPAIDIFLRDSSKSFNAFLSLTVPELVGANVNQVEDISGKVI